MSSHAFLFADLCGFTAYTHRHGDARAAELAVSFHERVCELAATAGCEVVKSIGDAVMVRASDPDAALRLGSRVVALGRIDGQLHVRAGIDGGPAVRRADDWFGSTVNTAARVADAAMPGELMLTDRARAALAGGIGVRLFARGERQLKGLPNTLLHMAAA